MYKIGIIGTENSHAMAFAKYYNLPDPETGKYHQEDVRVVGVMGDPESTAAIIKETGAQFVAEKVEDFFGKVDGIMITSRRGSVHKAYAMPFVERQIPLFVDKPFTSDLKEAEELMAAVEANNCPIMGGSACKYLPAIREIKELTAQLREKGEFMSAAMSFRVVLDSEYDGLYFYAPHLVEMCLEAFGPDIKYVQAMRTGKNLQVNVQYENDAVSLHFVAAGKQSCVVFAKDQNHYFDISTAGLYALEAEPYAALLRGEKESLSAQTLVQPIRVLRAIQEAMDTGKVVAV
jgi:predicted dehydrogenase